MIRVGAFDVLVIWGVLNSLARSCLSARSASLTTFSSLASESYAPLSLVRFERGLLAKIRVNDVNLVATTTTI
jgi:hypothetical protein